MNDGRLAVAWIVGVLLSAVLLYVGIVKPSLASPYHETEFSGEIKGLLRMPNVNSTEPVQRNPPDYLIGAGGPVLILGACALMSTMRRKGERGHGA